MLVGLVSDPRWEPPGESPEHGPPGRGWHVPWRLVVWVVVLTAMALLVPVAEDLVGELGAYGLLLATVVLAAWRVDRWCSRQYWQGLREHRS